MTGYEEILSRMKKKYTEISGYQVPELSDIDIRMKVLAGELFNSEVNLEFIKRQMFPSTATSQYLDLHAQDRGLSRKQAVKATGTVRFYINEPIEEHINIPMGTVVSTEGDTQYRYLTDEAAVLTAGSTVVNVRCTAEKGGSKYNVKSGNITAMVTNVVGIEGVTNPTSFSGGVDLESDEGLRKRILNSFVSISNGTNKAYYKQLAESVDGVSSASVIPKVRGVGTVNVYICCEKTEASPELVNQVQSIMDRQRELNVDVKVYAAKIVQANFGVRVVLKQGYSESDVRKNVRKSVSEYMDMLEVGEDIYESHLGKAVLSAEGVYNYSWLSIYPRYVEVDDDSIAVFGNMVVEVED